MLCWLSGGSVREGVGALWWREMERDTECLLEWFLFLVGAFLVNGIR